MTAAAAARAAKMRKAIRLAAAGVLAVELTADGVRIRDDLPVPYELTDVAQLVLADVDAPIPLALA